MTPEQFQTILSNQGILGELYREQKYQRHLAKNRAEKMRSRLRKQGVFPITQNMIWNDGK
jgi:hypothetical protein